MEISNTVKEAAKKVAMVWATKKGLQWTGSLLKIGLFAGAGYYIYTLIRDRNEEPQYLDDNFDSFI